MTNDWFTHWRHNKCLSPLSTSVRNSRYRLLSTTRIICDLPRCTMETMSHKCFTRNDGLRYTQWHNYDDFGTYTCYKMSENFCLNYRHLLAYRNVTSSEKWLNSSLFVLPDYISKYWRLVSVVDRYANNSEWCLHIYGSFREHSYFGRKDRSLSGLVARRLFTVLCMPVL